ncbi:HET-domain-containing protein [Periconia macrospinosa]|uniref:HET-domain-containing protein n=1 Tax=Periconia macrospinosa TaxID=97972 RepID=A0A2V1DFP7_9PLEO|nr:HET-domain-containing protein [Periconia macrospinosa]
MEDSQNPPVQGSQAAVVIPEQSDVTQPGPDKREFQPYGLDQPLYFPLLEGQVIRLIELSPGAWNDPISIRLLIAELHNAPEYDALSYVWGNPANTVPISCNGREFQVTPSLYAAFKRIRLTYRPRIVWADAICINQSNTKEKSHHVAFMSEVYRRAHKVLICMGRDTEGAAEDVASLVDDVTKLIANYKSIADMPVLEATDALCSDVRWKSMAKFQNLPWFTRAWVVQEVGLAKDPRVLYGPVEFSYRDLMKVAAWTMRRAPNLDTRAGVSFYSIHVDWENWMDDWRDTATYPENNIVDLFNQARWLGCSNPRDHIYSLLGHPLARLEDGTGLIMDPDYEKDHMQVWFELAVRLLGRHGLSILSPVEHNEDHLKTDYPSWVPWCWPEEYTSCTLGAYYGFFYRADGGVLSAPSGRKPAVDDLRQLHAQGVSFDVVKNSFAFTADDLASSPEKLRSMAASVREGPTQSDMGSTLALRSIWQQAWQLGETSTSAYGDAWLDAFSLTLIAGITTYDSAEDDMERHRRDFQAYFRLWLQANYDLQSPDIETGLKSLGGVESTTETDAGDPERYYVDYKLMSEGRSFFFTKKGYFGLGPCITKPGDFICTLFGAKCPFVLREQDPQAGRGRRYKLVQDGYVHGIMRGEAMKPFKAGEVQEESFTIC